MHTINLERCRCTSDGHIFRWLEPVRRPETDADWDALVAREDAEESVALAHQEFLGSL